jgi:hypothetical protein
MRDLDEEYLAELRAQADAVRRDLEERELQDPIAAHETIMQATKSMPVIIHKTNAQARVMAPPPLNNDDEPPSFNDDQVEQLASVLAEFRSDLLQAVDAALAPLQERIAVVEGKLEMLTTLLGSGNSKSFEASEVIRKLKVR